MRTLRLFLLLFTLVMFPLAAGPGPGHGGGSGSSNSGPGSSNSGPGSSGGKRHADDIVTPEPATWAMLATGFAGVLVGARFRNRKKQ
jgi:hypothetical protein